MTNASTTQHAGLHWRLLLLAAVFTIFLVSASGCSPQNATDTQETVEKPKLQEVGVVETTGDRASDYSRAFEANAQAIDAEEAELVTQGKVGSRNKKWTVMVYMVGSNLESQFGAATSDINEMLNSGVDFSKVNVVVYTGGSKRWTSDIPNDCNCVLDLSKDESERIVASTEQSVDMGAPQTLASFVNFSTEQYPADKYALVLWDHGGGPLWGYGADELAKNDSLTLAEMQMAMSETTFNSENKLDIVGFDACLMGSVENACVWDDYADYLIASEEVEAGDGWNYSFLSGIAKQDALEAGTSIVELFGAYYEEHATLYSNPDATLSLCDLSKAPALSKALDEFSGDLSDAVADDQYAAVNRGRANAKMFGLAASGSRGDGYDLIDVVDLCDQLSDLFPESTASVKSAVSDMVVANSTNIERCNGLSLYFAGDNRELYNEGSEVYSEVAPCSGYRELLNTYAEEWMEASDADWTLAEPQLSEDGSEYTLQLTDEQAKCLSSAHYSVLQEYQGRGYEKTTCDIEIELDDNNVAHVPADPTIITSYCVDETGKPDTGAWLFHQIEHNDSRTSYRAENLRLGDGTSDDIMSVESESVATMVVSSNENGEMTIREFDIGNDIAGLGGKGTIEAEHYEFIWSFCGTVLAPTRDENNTLLPYNEWDSSDIYVAYISEIANLEFRETPVSEAGLSSPVCQITFTDVNGIEHGSELCDLPTKEQETATVETDAGTLTFATYEDHAEAIAYEGSDTELTIPGEVDGLPVTAINNLLGSDTNVGTNETVTKIVVPEGVQHLGKEAFAYFYSLQEISLPDGLKTIGQQAFSSCRELVTLDIPDSVESIGSVFISNSGVEEITLPESLSELRGTPFMYNSSLREIRQDNDNGITKVQDGVLMSADGKTVICCPPAREGEFEIPDGVETIGDGAFYSSSITKISIPDSVRDIGSYAFFEVLFNEDVVIPDSVESIGSQAFSGYFFTTDEVATPKLTLGSGVSYIGPDAFSHQVFSEFQVNEGNAAYASKGGFITNKAGDTILYAPGSNSLVVTIPDGITSINPSLFIYYPNETEYILPDSYFRIDKDCFPYEADTGEFSESITEDTPLVFHTYFHCSEGSAAEEFAQKYDIPYDTETEAFTEQHVEEGNNFFDFHVYSDHASVVDYGFTALSSGEYTDYSLAYEEEEIAIPAEVDGVPVTSMNATSATATGSSYARKLVLPASITNITWEDCYPSWGVEEIAIDGTSETFQVVDGMLLSADGKTLVMAPKQSSDTIVVPDGVKEIGPYAFYSSTAPSVELPSSLKEIGSYAFSGTSYLQSIELPPNLEVIGASAFNGSSVQEVTFNDGLEEIKKYAFSYSHLSSVHLPDSVERIEANAFSHIESYDGLTLPRDLEYLGSYAFEADTLVWDEEALESYEGDLLQIGSESLTIGPELEHLGECVFEGLAFSEFVVDEDNDTFIAQDGMVLSPDGKTLFLCAPGASGQVTIPDGVHKLENQAISAKSNVTDVYVPDSVEDIGYEAIPSDLAGTLTIHCSAGSTAKSYAESNGIAWVEE